MNSGSENPERWTDTAPGRFPSEFDPDIYRALNSIVERMGNAEARAHYRETGRPGGWRANALATREDLVAIIADAPAVLEIGHPEQRLLPAGDRTALLPPSANPGQDGPLFDVALSSHQISAVPDFVEHLRQVADSLKPGGLYVAMIPDKRYCLDHFQPATTIGAVLDAYRREDAVSSWRAQVDSLTLETHNDPLRHWLGDHGSVRDVTPDDIAVALATAEQREEGAPEAAAACRTWFFTPSSFRTIVWLLRDVGLCVFEPLRVYPTLRDSSEFWAVLRKPYREEPQTARADEEADAGDDGTPVLPYDAWAALQIPGEAARGRNAVRALADRETEPMRWKRFAAVARQQAADAGGPLDQRAHVIPLEFPAHAPDSAPSLTRPVPGMNRVMVSFCQKGASGILLGLYTPSPVQYFRPLALPEEITAGHTKAHGITMDDRRVYIAMDGKTGQSLLALWREDLSFAGLHRLRRASDVHSILLRDGWLYAVSTGTEEVLRYPMEGGVPGDPEVWWSSPTECRVDLRHLNAIWPDGEGFLVSAMDRRGIFPAQDSRSNADGVIMSLPSGEIILEGLWFPHSVMRIDGALAYVQSGCATLNVHGAGVVRNLPGFPRGLCRVGDLLLIGTSETSRMELRQLQTPAVRCSITQCQIKPLQPRTALDLSYWGRGIYDLFPLDTPHTGAST